MVTYCVIIVLVNTYHLNLISLLGTNELSASCMLYQRCSISEGNSVKFRWVFSGVVHVMLCLVQGRKLVVHQHSNMFLSTWRVYSVVVEVIFSCMQGVR